jgi:Rrf2 family iron-sulfur cluster assembly transcriptional regulator
MLLELGGASEPVASAYLAEKTGMTLRTVENIHAVLRREGITAGTVGPKGGIRLLTPLKDISLGTLVYLFDDGVQFAVCCGDKSNECPNQAGCEIRKVWKAVSGEVQDRLDAISLEAIVRQYPQGPRGLILNTLRPEGADS